MIVILCFILSSKSRTKSDYDKNIEDDEQMNYLKEKWFLEWLLRMNMIVSNKTNIMLFVKHICNAIKNSCWFGKMHCKFFNGLK